MAFLLQEEDGNSEEEDEFVSTCQNSSAPPTHPNDPPPAYCEVAGPSSSTSTSTGIRYSQSASSELHGVGGPFPRKEAGVEAVEDPAPGLTTGPAQIPQSQSESEGIPSGHFGTRIQTMQTEENLSKVGDGGTEESPLRRDGGIEEADEYNQSDSDGSEGRSSPLISPDMMR